MSAEWLAGAAPGRSAEELAIEERGARRLRISALVDVLDVQERPVIATANRRFIVGTSLPARWRDFGEVEVLPPLPDCEPADLRAQREMAQAALWRRACAELEASAGHQVVFVIACGSHSDAQREDMPSFAALAADRGHRVEVWVWSWALSPPAAAAYSRLKARYPDERVSIHYLDEHRERILFCAPRSGDSSDNSSAGSGGAR